MRICHISRATALFTAIALIVFPVAAESELHKVVAVPTAKTLQLENGTLVRLAAIQAPNLARNPNAQDDPLAQQAHNAMQQHALNKHVRLESVGIGKDRRGRMVAMVYEGDTWLQAAMLREGMAWVYTFDDSRKYANDLLAAEHAAEMAQRGVWSEAEYAVLTSEETSMHLGEFRLVEGKVAAMAEVRGHYYLNFGNDWKTDFTLVIDKNAAKNFDTAWIESLVGKTVRARGWLFQKNGPAIALSHPEQVEIMHEEAVADISAGNMGMRD